MNKAENSSHLLLKSLTEEFIFCAVYIKTKLSKYFKKIYFSLFKCIKIIVQYMYSVRRSRVELFFKTFSEKFGKIQRKITTMEYFL